MKKLLTLKPDFAFNAFFVLPSLLWLASLLIGTIWQINFFIVISFAIFGLNFLFLYLWRLSLGILVFNSLPDKISKPTKTHFFFLVTMLIYFPGTIIAILWLININSIWFILCIVLIIVSAWPISYFQCNYIAKSISIIYYNDLLIKELWPVNWVSIGYYPMTAKKVHKVLLKIIAKPTPNST